MKRWTRLRAVGLGTLAALYLALSVNAQLCHLVHGGAGVSIAMAAPMAHPQGHAPHPDHGAAAKLLCQCLDKLTAGPLPVAASAVLVHAAAPRRGGQPRAPHRLLAFDPRAPRGPPAASA
ncbi:MAG: hypothetical protein HZA24_12110 [Nitrospirae bacterium]|nr:hypothetical protein [Nitrospirota bacterium]